MNVEILSVRDKRDRAGYIEYTIKITGKFDVVDFDDPNTYFAGYKNIFTAEHHPHVKNESNGWRLPGLEQIGPDLPYPQPYWRLCKAVGEKIENIGFKKTLSPSTAKTFGDIIDEL
jgi:hypothetical protein